MKNFFLKPGCSHLFKRLLHCRINRDVNTSEGVEDMSKIAGELVVPQEAELVVELDGSNGLGEVGHNSLEELVVDCQADEQLEFVVLSKAATGCLYPGYQPELVEGKNHRLPK